MTLSEYVAKKLLEGTRKHFSGLHDDYLQTALIEKETHAYLNIIERNEHQRISA
jgi:hypothetical protein